MRLHRAPAPLTPCIVLVLSALSGLAVPDARSGEYVDSVDPALAVYQDPGRGAWETIAPEQLIEECGLDPGILASIDASTAFPYAIVRYGRLCHEHYPPLTGEAPEPAQPGELRENYSATKTLGAAVVGRAVRMSATLPTPLSDEDRVDAWVGDITFNPDALIADVLAMIGHNESLVYGERSFSYDGDGSVQINRLSDVVEAVIALEPEHFGGVTTMGEFTDRHLFQPLGMMESLWPGEILGVSWESSLRDMARLGLLLVHEGVWDQRRVLDREWVRKMTHPAYEDTNTGYGYLTWVAANSNWYLPISSNPLGFPIGGCQPAALWPSYPHGLSESLDCGYSDAYTCDQAHDVGAFAAAGFGGQLIVGHRALDMVIVTKDAGAGAFVTTAWDLVKDAVIAVDPVYKGDADAFCADYAAGAYAPDLITVPEPAGSLSAFAALLVLVGLRRYSAARRSGV